MFARSPLPQLANSLEASAERAMTEDMSSRNEARKAAFAVLLLICLYLSFHYIFSHRPSGLCKCLLRHDKCLPGVLPMSAHPLLYGSRVLGCPP